MDANAKTKLEQTQGWRVAIEYFGEPAFNQNAQVLAEKINTAIENAIVNYETSRVIRKVARESGRT